MPHRVAPAVPPPLDALRRAWRAALLRHEAGREAGREADTPRAVAERFLALLADRPADGGGAPGAVADMALRAALAASIMAEVEALERAEKR